MTDQSTANPPYRADVKYVVVSVSTPESRKRDRCREINKQLRETCTP